MEVVFHDDLMRLRTANGPADMATVRHVAINIIKSVKDKAGLKVKRKSLGWNEDYLFNAVTGLLLIFQIQ